MSKTRRRSGSRKARSTSNSRSRSGNDATQGPTLVTRAGPSEGMGESIPLTEIKILDRDGQPAHDADVSPLIRNS